MYRIEYTILKLLFYVFQNISIGAGKKIALFVYYLTYGIFRYRRKIILNNLKLIYGDQFPKSERQLLRGIYKNFIFLWMEFLQNNKVNEENISKIFTLNNKELFDRAYEAGKGVILISGHMGNFEWLGQMHSAMGYKITGVAKRQKNPYVNELVEKNRTFNNLSLVYTKDAMKEGLRALKKKEILAMVVDQDAKSRGVFVDFLGRPSSTAVGPAVFHLKTGAPIFFLMSIRKDYGKFDAYYEEVCSAAEPAKISEAKIIEITQKHSAVLEKWVRKYPEQWFWMHRRWKTKPVGVKSVL
jgi:Kdo2-lipid IVA lauroyltransferase/acyltransferase